MLFGTDGIRGIVDKDIDVKLAYSVGNGIAYYLNSNKHGNEVVIGCDTRLSADTLVSAMSCALSNNGINIDIVGIVATPIISYLVANNDYDLGIMITASHNDYTYNGIKVFDSNGEKISKSIENIIEENINTTSETYLKKGKINYDESIINQYIDYLLNFFNIELSNKTIVLDCANGSNYNIAPYIYKKFNANVIKIHSECDGENINNLCGANHIDDLVNAVIINSADYGFAFDGDGDRLRVVLKNGVVIGGDDILLLFAMYLNKKHCLNNLSVVGTIMTNLGVEEHLNNKNISLLRSDVGDKNVVSMMKSNDINLGGEPSGHICIIDHIPSCDALFNSLYFIECCQYLNLNITEFLKEIPRYPAMLKNINVTSDFRLNYDNNDSIKNIINKLYERYKHSRIVVRPSGTEPVIRIYVESHSDKINNKIVKCIEKVIKKSST